MNGDSTRDGDSELAAARQAFLTAGLTALSEVRGGQDWVQVGLGLDTPAGPQLYSELAEAARALLDEGTAVNFFFLHKPPGLRVRFQAAAGRYDELRVRVGTMAQRLPIRQALPAVYEPEAALFGGSTSMDFVHQLFTADSLGWLDVHRNRAAEPVPAWAVSLLLLRAVFDGLGIVGWEDRGVWDLVRHEAGRRLDPAARQVSELDRAAAGLAKHWAAPAQLRELLPPGVRAMVDRHREQAVLIGARWRAGYFETGAARIGPRRCAAHYTVFHWNRARLSGVRQCLLAEALADPKAAGSDG
ncbi:MAG: thiopeptide-type bacteriocin biosynthesis protein [Pseudonocardiaceae bacterium]